MTRTPATAGSVVAVVLAAGASRRFGSPKQLAPWRGETLVHRAARLALESSVDGVRVVVGNHAAEVSAALADLKGLPKIENPRWSEGQSTSVRAAVVSLDDSRITGLLFLPCDQPLLRATTLDRLAAVHREAQEKIVVCRYGERRGAPVLWPRRFFPALAELSGDTGGRPLLRRFAADVLDVEVDPREGEDVDTPADLAQLTCP